MYFSHFKFSQLASFFLLVAVLTVLSFVCAVMVIANQQTAKIHCEDYSCNLSIPHVTPQFQSQHGLTQGGLKSQTELGNCANNIEPPG